MWGVGLCVYRVGFTVNALWFRVYDLVVRGYYLGFIGARVRIRV